MHKIDALLGHSNFFVCLAPTRVSKTYLPIRKKTNKAREKNNIAFPSLLSLNKVQRNPNNWVNNIKIYLIKRLIIMASE